MSDNPQTYASNLPRLVTHHHASFGNLCSCAQFPNSEEAKP